MEKAGAGVTLSLLYQAVVSQNIFHPVGRQKDSGVVAIVKCIGPAESWVILLSGVRDR